MQVHVARRVDSTPLPYTKALLPVFEAIINSIHAIEDAGHGDGEIHVYLSRDLTFLGSDQGPAFLPDITGVRIIDNGIGFTKENQEAFDQIDTPHKLARGGKGLGRLTWLKAFERAEIDSTYTENGGTKRCRFTFVRSPKGMHDLVISASDEDQIQTAVALVNLKQEYRSHYPKRAETIARRVIEHCFPTTYLGGCPRS